MKAYTTIEQSQKLAEILPPESADMSWIKNKFKNEFTANLFSVVEMQAYYDSSIYDWGRFYELTPCWSLAALLSLMPRIEHLKPFIDLGAKLDSEEVSIYYHSENSPYIVRDNLIDTAFEMIIRLHKQNII